MKKIKAIINNHPHRQDYINASIFLLVNISLIFLLFQLSSYVPTIVTIIKKTLRIISISLKPIILSLIFAYILSPLVSLYEKKILLNFFPIKRDNPLEEEAVLRKYRVISIATSYISVLFILIGLLYGFAFVIIGKIIEIKNISNAIVTITNYIFSVWESLLSWAYIHLPDELNSVLSEIASSFEPTQFNSLISPETLIDTFGNVISILGNILLAIIISIYLLADSNKFKRIWRKSMHLFLPQKPAAIITETLIEIDSNLKAFIKGAIIDGLIVAVLSSTILSLLDLDFSLFIGLLAGIFNIIPYFGPLLSMIPAFIIAYFSKGIIYALIIIAFLFLVQQLDGDLIYPRIVGRKLGLHPIYIFLSVTFGGYYFGFLGMIFSVPVATVLKIIISKLFLYLIIKK